MKKKALSLVCSVLGLSCLINIFMVYRLICDDSRLNTLEKKSKVVTVGENGDYSSILVALQETDSDTAIHISSGDYYIEKEYQDVYGDNFWEEYSGYEDSTDFFMRGLWLESGRVIYGDAQTNIYFDLETDNSEVLHSFSLFVNSGNISLSNLNIYINTNCRYALMNDAGEKDTDVIIENVEFHGGGANNSVAAINIGEGVTYTFDSCRFLDNQDKYDVYAGTGGVNGRVIISNCFGANDCELNCGEVEDNNSELIVSNSQFADVRYMVSNNQIAEEDNRLVAWNNILANRQ